jgi:hypothetical protein
MGVFFFTIKIIFRLLFYTLLKVNIGFNTEIYNREKGRREGAFFSTERKTSLLNIFFSNGKGKEKAKHYFH